VWVDLFPNHRDECQRTLQAHRSPALGETDFDGGFRVGCKMGSSLAVRLTIKIDGVNRFVTPSSVTPWAEN
jgi:hypothetical protein